MDSITLNILNSLGSAYELMSADTTDNGAQLWIRVKGGNKKAFFNAIHSVDFSSALELYPRGIKVLRFNNRSSAYVDLYFYYPQGTSEYSRCK